MKELIINNLYIEVTRRCNLKCNHCLRGDKEKIDLNIQNLNQLFDNKIINIKKINHLTITGGEPTLNIDTIQHIIKKIIEGNIIVEHFIMVINGKIYNQDLINDLNKFYEYYQCHYHHYYSFLLICSQDQFHTPPKQETLNKYKQLPYFKSNYIYLTKEQILNIGRAYENKLGNEYSYEDTMLYFDYYKNNNYPNITKENKGTIKLDELYLSAKGLYSFRIIDVPFKQIDELCIYDINQMCYNILRCCEDFNCMSLSNNTEQNSLKNKYKILKIKSK